MSQNPAPRSSGSKNRKAAFTLAELLMCVAVTGVIFAGILGGYFHSTFQAAGVAQEKASALLVASSQANLK
jgi:prepilin-type N-terminal cleavage/methylation domain-containing protein